MKFVTAASAALVAMASLDAVSAHSYLVKPVGRIQSVRTDVDNSIGCPTNNKGRVTSFEAGEAIDVAYWRNNHLGGFIRWAIVPANEQLTAANFDKNVFYYTCRESGATCLPKGQNNRYSGDSSGDFTISCGDKIQLPEHLPAGDYVLQWMWFGVGSSYGNIGWAEPQFKSCADIKLTTAGTKSKPACPTFVGGDRVTKLEKKGNDVCFYYYSTEIAKSWYKGDNNKAKDDYKFGRPADYEKCTDSVAGEGDNGGAGNSTAPSTAPAPATTRPSPVPQPNPQPAPTLAPAPKPTTDAPKPAPAPKPTGKCGARRK